MEKDKIYWENEMETHITVRGNPQSKQQISSQRAISFESILEPGDPFNQSLFQFPWNEVTKSITTTSWMGWQSITRLLPAFHRASLTTIHQNIFTLLVGERHLYSRYVTNYKTKWPDLYHS